MLSCSTDAYPMFPESLGRVLASVELQYVDIIPQFSTPYPTLVPSPYLKKTSEVSIVHVHAARGIRGAKTHQYAERDAGSF